MLFTGDESRRPVIVLSGGEQMRSMIAHRMLEDPQCLILDGPTKHLDLESITSLNHALVKRSGTLIFGSHDVELIGSLPRMRSRSRASHWPPGNHRVRWAVSETASR